LKRYDKKMASQVLNESISSSSIPSSPLTNEETLVVASNTNNNNNNNHSNSATNSNKRKASTETSNITETSSSKKIKNEESPKVRDSSTSTSTHHHNEGIELNGYGEKELDEPPKETGSVEDSQKYLTSPFLRDASSPNSHFLPSHVSSPTPISLIYPQQFQPHPIFQHSYVQQQLYRQQMCVPYTNPSLETNVAQIDGTSPVLSTLHSFNLGRFKLREQPHETQRKSYKNENRCILPNPLIITTRDPHSDLARVIVGQVSVRLVSGDGKELPTGKQESLSSSDGLSHPLDEKGSASFSLKITDTSEGNTFRLLFVVSYTMDGIGQCEERILSNPFGVFSNRKKNPKSRNSSDKPIVLDIKGTHGPTTHETEVWIKGKGFSSKVSVQFGDKSGNILEVAENLITVLAPARPDIAQETKVQVLVFNKVLSELHCCEKKLYFTYLPPSIQ